MNYETLAADLARQARTRILANAKPPTHVSAPDVPMRHGDVPTMCGEYVDARDIDCEHPTCEGCQQAKDRFEVWRCESGRRDLRGRFLRAD